MTLTSIKDQRIISKLGSGTFGDVYLSEIKINNKSITVAAKVEKKDVSNPRLEIELGVYKKLQNVSCVPHLYKYDETDDFRILFIELLGPCLDSMVNKIDLATLLTIAIDGITILKNIHDASIIHRDIKPNNFLLDKEYDKLKIIDFGLSKKYLVNGEHIPFRKGRSLIGTARYASINMHLGIEPSRRDDLESFGYMLVYLYKKKLPWQGIRATAGKDQITMIGDIKMSTSLSILCRDMPVCFMKFIEYCRELKFDSMPDYDFIINLFETTAESRKIEKTYQHLK